MAEVWMARREAQTGASKIVAIKLLAAHLADKQTYQRMFVDEARLTMMLSHSNIVQVFDVGEDSGRSYLVMEWVDGLDLAHLSQGMREAGDPIPLEVVGHVIGELLRGLAYAHHLSEGDACRAIVHRDISPQNVLISVSGEVKITDFGVARLASEETSGVHVRGKLRYMPPEQLRGESKHPTTDLFAVGAVLQELLDGVRFRGGLDRDSLVGMVIAGEVPALRREGVPAELLALREGLLARDRADRIQSADQALALLHAWPGYRNTADQLARLVRREAGLDGPRSGLSVAVSTDELAIRGSRVGQDPLGNSQVAGSQAGGSSDHDASELVTSAFATDSAARSSATTPSVSSGVVDELAAAPVRRRRGHGRVAMALGLVGVGGMLALGLGVVPQTRGATEDPDHVIRSDSAVVAAPPTTASVGGRGATSAPKQALVPAEAEVRAEAEAEAEAGAGHELTPELEPGEPAPVIEPPAAERSPSSDRPQRRTKPAPAKVEFAAHEFFFVWVKVGGREVALEPVAKLSLTPGSHKVYLRESADKPWRKAGRIVVTTGHQYRVVLRKPGSVALERLD